MLQNLQKKNFGGCFWSQKLDISSITFRVYFIGKRWTEYDDVISQ